MISRYFLRDCLWLQANEIVCEYPPDGSGPIPETGVDCTWVGARCSEGYEPALGYEASERRFGCGAVTPSDVTNTTLEDVEDMGMTLTPLGCMEIAPEPEPEDIEAGVVYCAPQPFKPKTEPVVLVCPSGATLLTLTSLPPVLAHIFRSFPAHFPQFLRTGEDCPACCAVVPTVDRQAWLLDASAGVQPECFDTDANSAILPPILLFSLDFMGVSVHF